MTSKKQQIGRLAMRREGSFWNAYYALPNTMDNAILLASIKMTLVGDEKLRAAFIEVMKLALTAATEEALGYELKWPDGPIPAPESERSGHG